MSINSFNRIAVSTLVAASAFAFTACGDENTTTETTSSATTTESSSSAVVKSSDGAFEVTVPAGYKQGELAKASSKESETVLTLVGKNRPAISIEKAPVSEKDLAAASDPKQMIAQTKKIALGQGMKLVSSSTVSIDGVDAAKMTLRYKKDGISILSTSTVAVKNSTSYGVAFAGSKKQVAKASQASDQVVQSWKWTN